MSNLFRLLGVAATLGLAAPAWGQASDLFDTPRTAPEFWRAIRISQDVGELEQVATLMRRFLDLKPSEKELFDIATESERRAKLDQRADRGGLLDFLRLNSVPRFSDDPARDRQAKADAAEILRLAQNALKKQLGDERRAEQFIDQLLGDPEEVTFAAGELRRSGQLAVPFLLKRLSDPKLDTRLRAAVLELLTSFDQSSVPAILRYLDIADAATRLELLTTLSERPDFAVLDQKAETDPAPALWYLAGLPGEPLASTRDRARQLLARLLGTGVAGRVSSAELVRLADELYKGKKPFQQPDRVALWGVDAAAKTVTLPPTSPPVTADVAAEVLGLRYLGRALELTPDSFPAQVLYAKLAVTKSYLRHANSVPLQQANPGLYEALAKTPGPVLRAALKEGFEERNAPLVLGLTQALGDRADADAFDLFAAGLSFKGDIRVPLEAALAILKLPNPPEHPHHTRILEILGGTLRQGAPKAMRDKPIVIVADTDPFRLRTRVELLASLGYAVETVPTGRDLLARLRATRDVAFVMLDRHTLHPTLVDLLGSLRADPRCSAVPVFLVASTDRVTELDLTALLRRLALLIAATDDIEPNLASPKQLEDATGVKFQALPESERVAGLNRILDERFERAERLLAALEVPLTEDVIRRMRLVTLIAMDVDVPLTPARRQELDKLTQLYGALPTDGPEFQALRSRLVLLLGRLDGELQPDRRAKLDRMQAAASRSPAAGQMPSARSEQLERSLARLAAPYRRVAVVPEAFSEAALVSQLAAEPTVLPPAFALAASDIGAVSAFTQAEGKAREATLSADHLRALAALRRIAAGEVAGFDLRYLEAKVRGELESSDPARVDPAIDIARVLPSKDVQMTLANVAVRGNLPPPLRLKAVQATIAHVAKFGRSVTGAQAAELDVAIAGAADPLTRSSLVQLRALLEPDAATRQRAAATLRGYQPPDPTVVRPAAPAPAPAPAPDATPEEKKDPE